MSTNFTTVSTAVPEAASRRGAGLGVLAGIACVACCALPVLISAGVVSGAAATFLADKMPITAVVLAVGTLAAFALAARRKFARTGCGPACATADQAADQAAGPVTGSVTGPAAAEAGNGCGCAPGRR